MKLALILWLMHVLPQQAADPMCLATTVYLEARDQPELGQRAVAEVALRRLDSGQWGDSVCKVVTARGQFAMATVDPRDRLRDTQAWIRAWRIALRTEYDWAKPADQRHEVVPGASHFADLAHATPAWSQAKLVAVIGDHSFYRVARLSP
jgi:spore germination cell wall hydrolase CwlJ-like protein